jgi:hypothetical protein
MTLTADIKYKSNGQQGALKGTLQLRTSFPELYSGSPEIAKRRNKWICALKTVLSEVKIYGPGGNPDPPPSTTRYTKVPWETVQAADRQAAGQATHTPELPVPIGGWQLTDKNAVIRKLTTTSLVLRLKSSGLRS